jgi:hypothetical protein
MKKIVREGLEGIKDKFSKDELTLDQLDSEASFWLHVVACKLCDDNQMCSMHYDQLYNR